MDSEPGGKTKQILSEILRSKDCRGRNTQTQLEGHTVVMQFCMCYRFLHHSHYNIKNVPLDSPAAQLGMLPKKMDGLTNHVTNTDKLFTKQRVLLDVWSQTAVNVSLLIKLIQIRNYNTIPNAI